MMTIGESRTMSSSGMTLGPSRWLAVLTAALALLSSSPARASDPATAQALFDQGRKLMAEERWGEACPKLEESQRLDPAGGTLLHLALCREHEGRIATAWALYQDALAQAKADRRKDRAKIARERIGALGPRLPRIRVNVTPANRRVEGFTVSRDESVVGQAQWGALIPVDPGPHVLEAKAEGRIRWSKRIDVPARAQEIVVSVPELEIDKQAAGAVTPAAASSSAAPGTEDSRPGDGQRTAGVVLAGVGVAGAIVGSVFGFVSLSKLSDAEKECAPPDFKLCSAKGVEDGDSAQSAGNASTVAFIAGGLLLTGGLVLYFTAPSGKRVALSPSVSRHGASFGLSGRF